MVGKSSSSFILSPVMSISCADWVSSGPGGQVAVLGDLVERDHVLAPRLPGVAAGNHQVADRVVDRNPVHHLEVLEAPLHDLRRDEHRGVGVALAVELGVQRARGPGSAPRRRSIASYLSTGMPSRSPSNALSCDRLQHLGERVHRDDRGQLAAGHDVLAGRIDVHAVRRLGRRQVVDQPGAIRRRQHLGRWSASPSGRSRSSSIQLWAYLAGHASPCPAPRTSRPPSS